MRDVRVFRSLDKKNSFLGLKGMYFEIMVGALAVCLVIALFSMAFVGDLIGWILFGVLAVIAWVLVMKYQAKYTERELKRIFSMRSCPDVISVEPRSFDGQKRQRRKLTKNEKKQS